MHFPLLILALHQLGFAQPNRPGLERCVGGCPVARGEVCDQAADDAVSAIVISYHRRPGDGFKPVECVEFGDMQVDFVADEYARACGLKPQHVRCTGHGCSANQHEQERGDQREAHAPLVRYGAKKEHGDGDSGRQDHNHVVRMLVGVLHALEHEIGEVNRQVAEHAEVHHAFDHVGEVDAPEGPWRVYQVDERLNDFVEGAFLLFGHRYGIPFILADPQP